MKVEGIDLSPQKRKALHILLKESEYGIDGIYKEIDISRGSFFSSLSGKRKFKEEEYKEILNIVGITDEELEEFSKNSMIKFLLKKGI